MQKNVQQKLVLTWRSTLSLLTALNPLKMTLTLDQLDLQIEGLITNEIANGKKVYSYSTKSIKNDAYSGPA